MRMSTLSLGAGKLTFLTTHRTSIPEGRSSASASPHLKACSDKNEELKIKAVEGPSGFFSIVFSNYPSRFPFQTPSAKEEGLYFLCEGIFGRLPLERKNK